jgi:hypothetical protein
MRYSNKENQIVNKLKNDLSASQIRDVLIDEGFRERTVKSVQKKVDYFLAIQEMKEKRRQYVKSYAEKNPIRYRARTLLTGAKNRSKKRGLTCNLTLDWIIDKLNQGRCRVTGLEFQIKPYSKKGNKEKVNPLAPSLDRIDPHKGYTTDNVQVVVWAYNRFKGDATHESCVKVAEAIFRRAIAD